MEKSQSKRVERDWNARIQGDELQFEQSGKAFEQLSFKQRHEHRKRESHEEAQEKNAPGEGTSVWEGKELGMGSERRPGVRCLWLVGSPLGFIPGEIECWTL